MTYLSYQVINCQLHYNNLIQDVIDHTVLKILEVVQEEQVPLKEHAILNKSHLAEEQDG